MSPNGSAGYAPHSADQPPAGIANLIVWPAILDRFRRAALGATLLRCTGKLQREESVIHVVADRLEDMTRASILCAAAPARLSPGRRRNRLSLPPSSRPATMRATSSSPAAISANAWFAMAPTRSVASP